jgi:hypothetical protein
MQVGIIDEQDCFDLFSNSEPINAEYFIAPTSDYFERMLNFGKTKDLVIVHRHIWIDDCHKDDSPCNQKLDEFEKVIKPIALLRVDSSNHEACPQELYNVFQQVCTGYTNLGKLINTKVKPVNTAWKTPYLTIKKLEIIGDNQVGVVLENPSGDSTKYYKLTELHKYVEN